MIVVNVRLPTPGADRQALEHKMGATAPSHEKPDGLRRKSRIMTGNGRQAGDIHPGESPAKAEVWSNPGGTRYVTGARGDGPRVGYLERPGAVGAARTHTAAP